MAHNYNKFAVEFHNSPTAFHSRCISMNNMAVPFELPLFSCPQRIEERQAMQWMQWIVSAWGLSTEEKLKTRQISSYWGKHIKHAQGTSSSSSSLFETSFRFHRFTGWSLFNVYLEEKKESRQRQNMFICKNNIHVCRIQIGMRGGTIAGLIRDSKAAELERGREIWRDFW